MIRELLAQPVGLLVQGITGRQGRLETRWMIDSGVRISAGVTPGRGGTEVLGLPVYDTVAEAVRNHGNAVSMIYAPPAMAADAAMEAVLAGLRLVVISAERVPVHRMVRAIEVAKSRGACLIGPNSQGLVVPGVSRVGCPGGMDPDARFKPGDVAVVSRSGGMTTELAALVRAWGWGTSVQVHIGGAPLTGTTLAEAVQLAQQDPATKRTLLFGEPSGFQEEDLATAIESGALRLPVIVLLSGRFADSLPSALPFGHAPRAGTSRVSSVAEKVAKLSAAGALVAYNLRQVRELLAASVDGRNVTV